MQPAATTIDLSTDLETDNPHTMHSYPHLIVHYGELALKGKNRHRFESQLIRHLRAMARTIGPCEIRNLFGRVCMSFADPVPWNRLSYIATNIFGIANAHGMRCVAPTMAEIEAAALACTRLHTFSTFAVRCRRAEKHYPITSHEICVHVGRRIQEASHAQVDLDHPELTVWIELVGAQAFVGTHRVEGPGGLPAGISGKVAVLLSGGIDSPVAAWQMMRRGCQAVFIHFHSAPFTAAASQEKVEELARVLARWQGGARIAMVPFGVIQQQIVTAAPGEYRVILYRRLMVRIAERIARAEGCAALVTGESLGQVASQTLSNLATIDAVATVPILRPLIGTDKREIIDAARRIGTYDISIEPHDDCCSYLGPRDPATRTRVTELEGVEKLLDIPAYVSAGVTKTTWKNLATHKGI